MSVPAGHHRQDDETAGRMRGARCECGWRGPWRHGVSAIALCYRDWVNHIRKVMRG